MPDIHLDIGFFNHHKTKRLHALLGKGSEVLPIRLWCFTAQNHGGDGLLTGYVHRELEVFIGWWGKPGQCIEALVSAGFLDEVPAGWKVHDWQGHAGHLQVYRQRAIKAATIRWGHAERSNASSNASPPVPPPVSPSPIPPSSPLSNDESGEMRAGESLAGKIDECFGSGALPENRNGRATVTLRASLKPANGHQPGKNNAGKGSGRAKEGRRGPPADWTALDKLDALDRVILAWKVVSGVELDNADWDEVHYGRYLASAADLLKLFGRDYSKAGWCIAWVWADMERAKRSCTIETVVKHSDRYRQSDDWKRRVNEKGGR